MDVERYDRQANARFAEALQAWLTTAPDAPAAPQVGRDREGFICNSLLGPESRHLSLLWEKTNIFLGEERQVVREAFHVYFDHIRTPIVICEDQVILDVLPPRAIGRIYRDRDFGHSLLKPNGVPLGARDLARAAYDGISAELVPVIVTAKLEFAREREADASEGRIRDLSLIGEEAYTCSVHYSPTRREAYVENHATHVVEVLARGIDEDEARQMTQGRLSIEALRQAAACRAARPTLSSTEDISSVEAPSLELDGHSVAA